MLNINMDPADHQGFHKLQPAFTFRLLGFVS